MSGKTKGEASIGYGGATNAYLQYPIPNEIGARWVNAQGEKVEYLVPIDQSLIPKVDKKYKYEFILELRQNDIRQIELVIHERNKPRVKKRKVMLYCAEPNNACKFNSPFTTDTFYDWDSFTPEQRDALKKRQKAAKEISDKMWKRGQEKQPPDNQKDSQEDD